MTLRIVKVHKKILYYYQQIRNTTVGANIGGDT